MHEPILTLEPLVQAVQAGVEARGWTLSGLQKTTSHQFEGRWEGESTRSAYLFFHQEDGAEPASIDVFLDETTRGITGNLALVLELHPLSRLGDVQAALGALGGLGELHLPDGYRTPLTLRLRLRDGADEPGLAEAAVRFKLQIPRRALSEGHAAVQSLAHQCVQAFDAILRAPELAHFVSDLD